MVSMLGLAITAACGTGTSPSDSDRPDGGFTNPTVRRDAAAEAPGSDHTYLPTFKAIHEEIFSPSCAAVFCHNSEELHFNALTPELSYETTVSVVTASELCGPTGLERISPGHPEKSLLYLKLVAPPCGRKMPLTFTQQLDPREIEQIRIWIERGAPRYEADE